MRLDCDNDGSQNLHNAVTLYYVARKHNALIFEQDIRAVGEKSKIFVRFLAYRKHVVEYQISRDRSLIAMPGLAIGPHFFTPAEFWDYENSLRFTLEPTTEGVEKNLRLMDEFFGY